MNSDNLTNPRGELFAAMRRDINQLRQTCRTQGTPEIQAALDKCEPWLESIRTDAT